MNNFLAKFSDFDKKHEKRVEKVFHPKKVCKKKKKSKKIIEINHAKGLSYSEFLNSKYWFGVRKQVLQRDKYECVVCHTKKIYVCITWDINIMDLSISF